MNMEKIRVWAAIMFSTVVALILCFGVFAIFYIRLKNPQADITIWRDIVVACLSYIVGMLAALFGISPTR